MPHYVIALSGNQPMPNLLGLLAYQNPAPDGFYILHSSHEKGSLKPAHRLRSFVKKHQLAAFCETIRLESEYPDIQIVSSAVHAIMSRHPDSEWTLNATGGIKPMSVALSDYADMENVRILYREEDGSGTHWKRWSRDEESWLTSSPFPLEESADLSLKFPITDLAQLHIDSLPGYEWKANSMPGAIEPEILLRWIETGPRVNWNWGGIVRECGPDWLKAKNAKGGIIFEYFIAALIQALGVSTLAVSLRLAEGSSPNAPNKSEIDIVATSGNSLFLFELKLANSTLERIPGGHSLIARASQVAQMARSLGGRTGTGILILPGYTKSISPEMDDVAEILGMRNLWRQEDMPNLISNLVSLFKIRNIPEKVKKIDTAIKQAASYGPLFSLEGKTFPFHPKLRPNPHLSLKQVTAGILSAQTDSLFASVSITSTLLHFTVRCTALTGFIPERIKVALSRHGLICEDDDLLRAKSAFHDKAPFIHLRLSAERSQILTDWLSSGKNSCLPLGFTKADLPARPEAEEPESLARNPDALLTEIAILKDQITQMKRARY